MGDAMDRDMVILALRLVWQPKVSNANPQDFRVRLHHRELKSQCVTLTLQNVLTCIRLKEFR